MWLLFVAFGMAGYLVGRLVPFTGQVESVAALLAGAFVAGAVVMRRGNALKWPSSFITALVFGGCLTYWLGMMFGNAAHVHHSGGIQIGDVSFLVLGGLLLAYVLLYRRSRDADAGRGTAHSSKGYFDWRQRWEETRGKPWNVAGWLVVALLVMLVFIPCLIVIPLALWIPAYQSRQAASEMGTLTIDFDPTMPIIEIEVLGGDSNVGQVFPVATRPIPLRFPTGQYQLAIRYEHGPKRYTLEMPFTIARGGHHFMNLSLAIQNDFNQKLNDDRLPTRLPGESENTGREPR
jgi:hypothetical protein